ncbi:penicillin-binding protein 2 [Oscillatoria sp. CS-180]|uniref:peptidoglycan D,D-transpeptidase FtsI family protein n=1 Tax=Oscillatoria sp. CS-180 TaxID=3021720 RepID=UPI00232C0872|nr:penicillin-binding protein 2 [Oscillatoria sp. CS-180]MDB9528145.1 penicillin-binding protein 2 [Oscillatoria sp. CS-180]
MGSYRSSVRKRSLRSPAARKRVAKKRAANAQKPSHRTKRPSPIVRIVLVWLLLVAIALGLAGRLAYLQLFNGDTLQAIAQQQRARQINANVGRRSIIDNQGIPLAVDRLVYTLYGHPALFRQPISVVAQTLSPVLEIPAGTLAEQFKGQATGLRIVDDLPEETARRIQQLRLDGLELVPSQQRFYPQQDLFSQIVGFVNLEGKAQTGLEAQYEKRLSLPMPQAPHVVGPALPVINLPTEETSQQLQLTLDNRLQRIAQEALRQTLRKFGAQQGTVMVMEVHTGELRAFAVEPTFDPNRYFDANLGWLKNWAVTDLYEPGSTFKPINVAIALEADAITPDDTIYDEGRLRFGEWTIQNSDYEAMGGVGMLSIADVLRKSSNVGMVRIMEQLPASEFYAWLEKLELDRPTNISLPAENAQALKEREQFVNSRVDAATAAFGQGIALTPIKLLQLQAAIANGGYLVTPKVVKGLVSDTGQLTWQPDVGDRKSVFSQETADAVLKMMETVVEDGTGEAAQIPGYRIAGKTGTSQKVTEGGVYGSGRITSFVGLLPVEAPQFVVLAVIDEPLGDDAYGSTVAAPLVRTVMESLVVLEGIPPSSPQALGGVMSP